MWVSKKRQKRTVTLTVCAIIEKEVGNWEIKYVAVFFNSCTVNQVLNILSIHLLSVIFQRLGAYLILIRECKYFIFGIEILV